MATAFVTGSTVITGLVAALKAAILTSTDYSNPAGDRVLAVTTRGSDICVDLADAAASAVKVQFGVYRTSGLSDKVIRYCYWRPSGGATSDTVHWRVSAGKEHLYIDIEGPRGGEVNAPDSATGAVRQCFFIGDVVPYFASDTVPAVVLIANRNTTADMAETTAVVSRNQGDTSSWVSAVVTSLLTPVAVNLSPGNAMPTSPQRMAVGDGKLYMWPYVIVEAVDGVRGRIAKAFYNGFSSITVSGADVPPPVFSRVTYDGDTYMLLNPHRHYTSSPGHSPFGAWVYGSGGSSNSPVVAIPFS